MTERFAHSRVPRRIAHRAVLLLALACGGSPERPPRSESDSDISLTTLYEYDPTAPDGRDVYATGACVEAAVRVCRVYLPSHNDVQPCFVGEQLCAAGQWGECESGVLVDANADDVEIDPETLP